MKLMGLQFKPLLCFAIIHIDLLFQYIHVLCSAMNQKRINDLEDLSNTYSPSFLL